MRALSHVKKGVIAALGVGFASQGLELAKAGEYEFAVALGLVGVALLAVFAWLLERQVTEAVRRGL